MSSIDAIPEDRFLVSSDQEIVDHLTPQLLVAPITLKLAASTMSQTETRIHVSGYRMRTPGDPYPHSPYSIPGTRVDIDIPYTGEDWIFRYRTNPHRLYETLRGEARQGNLRISISLPHDAAPGKFKEAYEHDIDELSPT